MTASCVRSVFITCMLLSTSTLIYLMTLEQVIYEDVVYFSFSFENLIANKSEEFLVHSKTCIINKMDPFDVSLKGFVRVQKEKKCISNLELTYVNGFEIHINLTAANHWGNFSHCEYIPFIKKPNADSGAQLLLKNKTDFMNNITATHSFVLVKCFNTSKNLIQHTAYAFFFRNVTKDKLVKKMYETQPRYPLNVLIFGFESTSRMNFLRHMNETRNFINTKLGAVEMQGYNKMGLNTFPNKVAAFLGIPEGEMHYDNKFLDKYPFIWKNFSAAGYRTFYIEDDTNIATFKYLKSGFKDEPVDHYLRTFTSQVRRKNYCSGNVSLAELMINKVYEYVDTYHDVPHYADIFIGMPTHDNNNGLGILDIPYLNLIKKLHSKGYLNNTVLIFFGDHGSRYGSLRSTYQGRLEEQLPILSLVVPEWFKKEKTTLFQNLQNNAHKLTSNFDIYATFLDIMSLGKGQQFPEYMGKYGTSLFRNIRSNRTCPELRINPAFCACSNFFPESNLSSTSVKNGAKWALDQINLLLSNNTDLCEKLYMKKIKRASKSIVNFVRTQKQRFEDYVIMFEVEPSGAVFEGAVRYDTVKKTYMALGPTQRLNKYSGQSTCVANIQGGNIIERYCYCKKI